MVIIKTQYMKKEQLSPAALRKIAHISDEIISISQRAALFIAEPFMADPLNANATRGIMGHLEEIINRHGLHDLCEVFRLLTLASLKKRENILRQQMEDITEGRVAPGGDDAGCSYDF